MQLFVKNQIYTLLYNNRRILKDMLISFDAIGTFIEKNQTVLDQYTSVCQNLDTLYSDAALGDPKATRAMKGLIK